MKNIETLYNGYRFRSRAEARWAVFFDTCGIKYVYEPEGYELSDGTKYLPDFYLPESDSFFEVKGILSKKDKHKIDQFQEEVKRPITIGYADMTFQSSYYAAEDLYFIDYKSDSAFVRCCFCRKLYFLSLNGSYACPNCGHYNGDATFHEIICGGGEKRFRSTAPEVEAFQIAKQARFEYGENPKGKCLNDIWERKREEEIERFTAWRREMFPFTEQYGMNEG